MIITDPHTGKEYNSSLLRLAAKYLGEFENEVTCKQQMLQREVEMALEEKSNIIQLLKREDISDTNKVTQLKWYYGID